MSSTRRCDRARHSGSMLGTRTTTRGWSKATGPWGRVRQCRSTLTRQVPSARQASKRMIKRALFEVLEDRDEVERIFLIVKAQPEY